NWRRAEELAREELALAEEEGDNLWRAMALFRLAMAAAHRGDLETARSRASETLEIAERAPDPWVEAAALWVLGFLELSRGDPPAVDRWLSRADRITEAFGGAEPVN